MFREMRELFEAEIAEHEENLDEADPRCLHHHLVIIELDDDDEGACTITITINIVIITKMKTIFFQCQGLDRPVPGGGSEGERGVQQGAAGHRHHRPLCCWQVLPIIIMIIL